MNPQFKLLIFILFVVIICFGFYNEGQDMRKSHNFSIGEIITCNHGGKGNFGPGIYYVYKTKESNINGSRRHSELSYSIKELEGHFFPVVYKKHWWGYTNTILITPNDFSYYGYSFPDSLKWVLQYIQNRN